MLQLDGLIEYIPQSKFAYLGSFSYSIARYGESKGDISEVRIVPVFEGKATSLSSYFRREYPGGSVALLPESNAGTTSGKAGFSFSVTGASDWFVAPAVLKFVDRSGHQLAAVQIPIYAIDP